MEPAKKGMRWLEKPALNSPLWSRMSSEKREKDARVKPALLLSVNDST